MMERFGRAMPASVILGILWCVIGVGVLEWCNDHYKAKRDMEESQRIIRDCEFKKLRYTSKWGSESREYLCPDGFYRLAGPKHRNARGE